jgi:ABC-type transport system substrate-binding protein
MLPITQTRQIFGIENDVVGETANFTSWQNKEADDLMQQAAFLPGCDQAERKKLYDRVQEFMYEDAVYVPLYTERGFFVYNGNLQGNNPVPGLVRWDLDGWNLAE